MALDQLALYNEALLLCGQRKLSSLTEDREPRHRLDQLYNADTINYLLELAKPHFASTTGTLNSPSAATSYSYSHALPTDYVVLIEPYSNARLDQPISQYVIEGDNLLTDHAVVYLRYIQDDVSIANWDYSFFKFAAAFFAREVAARLAPAEREKAAAIYAERLKEIQALEEQKRSSRPISAPDGTLDAEWVKIYNDALFIMGLPEIAGENDDSNRRVKLTRALNAGIVEEMLEETGWQFALQSTKVEYDASVEPAWGYQRAFAKPNDLHTIDGLFTDEYMTTPLKSYQDENDYFFCDYDEFYLSYLSTTWLTTPASWPMYFRRLVAARMAKDAAMTLRDEGADMTAAQMEYEDRKSSALSKNAMQSPPRKIANGSWVRSRFQDRYNRNHSL